MNRVWLSSLLMVFSLNTAAMGADSSGDDGLNAEYRRLMELAKAKRRPVKAFDGTLDVSNSPAMGSVNAAVVLVEFGDYQCPYCRRHLQNTAQQLRTDWVLDGDLLYVFEDFPLEAKHPLAPGAAEAARCADEQGRYWEMRNVLYGSQKALHEAFLPAHAQAAGLDEGSFNQCMESGRNRPAVQRSSELGKSLGVWGTPAFFLGLNGGDGKVLVKRRIAGAVPYETFKKEIESLLAMASAMEQEKEKPSIDRRVSQTESGIR